MGQFVVHQVFTQLHNTVVFNEVSFLSGEQNHCCTSLHFLWHTLNRLQADLYECTIVKMKK